MFYPETFRITAPGDSEIEISRDFHAPCQLVFDALTKPELVRRWLLGPGAWTMPICEIDLRVNGTYRYVWRKEGVPDMAMGGVFQKVVMPSLLVATEKFDDAWYPGQALNTSVLSENGGVTNLRITTRYESKEARDTARRSGMEQGLEAGFKRLEEVLSSVQA